MSKIDRHSDLTPSPKAQRILVRAFGCGVEELVARLGAEGLSDPYPLGVSRRTCPVASLLLDLWLGRSPL